MNMENKWYMYRNKNTGQEVKREGDISQDDLAFLKYTGYELMRVIDLAVSAKEKAAK